MRPTLSIVIAVWDGLEHLVRCVDSIFRHTTVPFELILVDNASTDGAAEYCSYLEQKYRGQPNTVFLIRNQENIGFGPAQNQGAKKATGEYLCNLNSDVIVTPQWFERLQAHLTAPYPWPVAFVGPMSNNSAGRQFVPGTSYRPDTLDAFADAWYEGHVSRGERRLETGILFGWCYLSRKEVWDELGGFDESFRNAFEDNDLCLRANLAGYKLLIAQDTYLHHHGHATILSHGTMDDYARNGDTERKRFVNKWRNKGPKKLVAVMRIANCERTIKQVLDRTAEFANAGIIVHLCRSKDSTEQIAREHPAVKRVEVYDGPFQEDYERNSLLQWALEMHEKGEADWCISVDGDELYDHRMVERVQELMNPAWPHTFAYWCNWRTIWDVDWDGKEWYRADDTFGRFKNYRFFRLIKGQKILSEHPEGHHCGSAPVIPGENLKWVAVRVKHLGYETKEIRHRKFDFYQNADNFKDRRGIGHDDYRHLIDKTVTLRPYHERNEITVVSMIGNEMPFLRGFLEHLTPIADEFVLVNTLKEGQESDGSLDYVKDWIEESPVPVKLVNIPWNDNYALMRNLALQHAGKEWVLMLDPDERISPTEVQLILDMIDYDELDGWLFHVVNYIEPAGFSPNPKFISSDSIRLFRNIPEIYYTGIVHETPEDALAAIRMRDSRRGQLGQAPMVVHHHGYLKSGDKVRRKLDYYANLNERQKEVTHGMDPRPYFNLAMHWMEAMDYDRAISDLRAAVNIDPMLWRARTMMVAGLMAQARRELELVLRIVNPSVPVHQSAKKALDLVNQMPFLHQKVPQYEYLPQKQSTLVKVNEEVVGAGTGN